MVPATDTLLYTTFLQDIELFGLVSGLRTVAKKEGPDANMLMARSRQFRDAGWFIQQNQHTGCAYISADKSRLERLMELEDREFDGGSPSDRRQTIIEIGQALGYPECCAAAFASLPIQDDSHVMGAMLGRLPDVTTPIPWELNFLPPMVSPVFYYPCKPDCPASLDLARRYLDALDAALPGTAASIKAKLARPVLTASRWDFVVLDGKVDGAEVTYVDFSAPVAFHDVPAPSTAFQSFVSSLPRTGRIAVRDGHALGYAHGITVATAEFTSKNGLVLLDYR